VPRRSVLTAAALPAILIASALATATATAIVAASAVAAPKPSTTFKARIGWFYTDSPDFPQTKVGPLILHWAPCAANGGVKIAFPTGAHLYEGDNGNFSAKKPPVALLSGPPLAPSDPFKAILYVGDLAQPGTKSLTVKCIGKVKGKLMTLFSGPLKTEYVRQDVNLSPKSSLFSLNLLDLFGTEPSTQTVIARSCSEPGTPSITLSSPALGAGPAGGAYVTLAASDIQGTFAGTVTPAKGALPGEYEAAVSCGSGRVGVGTIGLH
jgi:hypothetical protein